MTKIRPQIFEVIGEGDVRCERARESRSLPWPGVSIIWYFVRCWDERVGSLEER